jgi:hypothetical protein
MSISFRRNQWQFVLLSIICGNLLTVCDPAFALDQTIPSIFESESFNLDDYLELLTSLDFDQTAPEPIQDRELSTDLFTPISIPATKIATNAALPSPARTLPNSRVQPNTTRWVFNGVPVNHLTSPELSFGNESGSNRNPLQSVNGAINLGGQTIEQTDAKGIYTLDYRGTFGQIQTLRKSHQVVTDVTQPSTMIGFRERLTLTGTCTLPGTPATSQCSYLPGLVTDRTSLNANQQPTRIDQPSQFGEVVTPASLTAIQQPGFQAGVNGQLLGVDLYFPNAGTQAGNGQSMTTIASRREEFQQTPAIAIGRIHQKIAVNDREAAIGRTIRGNAYIHGDQNLAISTGLQLATEALPEAIPALAAATSDRVPTINRNLFQAPDLARIPDRSFSLYHYGIAHAPHAASKVAKLTDIPPATYQGWWIGLSPVIARTQENRSRLQITGPQKIVNELGQEGGSGANVNVQSLVNGIQFDARQLQNVYQQAYVTIYNQDVTVFSNSKLTETTHYQPHFSYTGNITNSDAVFRYYAGALVPAESGLKIDRVNAYAGLDYSQVNDRGLTYGLGGMIYTSPDPEYHSYAIGSISQKFTLNPKNNLIVLANVNYVADGQLLVDRTLFQSANSSINLGASANLDRVSLGISQSFASSLPNSIQNTLSTSLALRLTDNFGISGYWTPWNENPIRSPYGVSANLRLGNSSSLSLGWSTNTTEFGRDPLNRAIEQHDRSFTVMLRVK